MSKKTILKVMAEARKNVKQIPFLPEKRVYHKDSQVANIYKDEDGTIYVLSISESFGDYLFTIEEFAWFYDLVMEAINTI